MNREQRIIAWRLYEIWRREECEMIYRLGRTYTSLK
jgi:hypothetical protein